MKRQFLLLLITVLFGGAINAQQITQQFSFSQNDVQVTQSGEYDIVSLPETEFLQGEDDAGKPQLPVKHFKLLLPQGAVATDVSITVNSENQLQGSFYLYPVQLPIYPGYEAPSPFVEPDEGMIKGHSLHFLSCNLVEKKSNYYALERKKV